MVRSAFVPLPGSEKSPLPGSKKVGPLPDDEQIEVSVFLRPRSPVPPPGDALAKPMTRRAFAQKHGADPSDIDKIVQYAKSKGLRVIDKDAARRLVILSGSHAAFCGAFDVDLARYARNGMRYRGRTGPIGVAPELSNIVQAVVGFDDRPAARPAIRPLIGAAATTFTGADLAKLYDFPQGDGQGEAIALIELGGGYQTADLQAYFKGLGISPSVTSVTVDGANNAPTGSLNDADGEVVLDIEVAGAIAPKAEIVVYFAPNTDRGFLDAVTQAVHDTTRKPSVVSISWGSPESQWTAQAMQAMSQAFQDAAALGVTICCAAGDNGSSDGETDNLAHADFPASSPYALGCGGTRLDASNGAIADEIVWNESSGGATGGGISDVFDLPSYQSSVGVPSSINPGKRVGRGVPDVAGNADPQTGYNVRGDGQDAVFGGTSAVAPLWAGLIAIINQKLGRPVGFLHPVLYRTPEGFRDITKGNNGGYTAHAGWDACTGLGSPNGVALLAALEKAAPSA
ncbi:MAG: peptidase propeptide [Rhodospirillales bacterium]|nr:peptidase propeptide [Rhodospirillales bacterium]